MQSNILTGGVRTAVIFSGVALLTVLFLPIWRIELSAPQYPEGLVLQIYANKLAGNVDIINGLNHYIGMKTLHTADFIEFTVLPYIVGFLAAVILLAGLINRRKIFVAVTILFIAISILAMADFWRWEYNYGHSLNPEAAIIVPGMAYQPPLLGYKQLLNFGAFSIPDTGGWIYIGVAVILTAICVFEIWCNKKIKKTAPGEITNKPASVLVLLLMMSLLFSSCNAGPVPIQLSKDNCEFCKMTFSDARFGAEIVTAKGKVYKFDDVHCLLGFLNSAVLEKKEINAIYFVDFSGTHDLKKQEEMILYRSDGFHTPMGGNIAAFSSRDSLNRAMQTFNGADVSWDKISRNRPAP